MSDPIQFVIGADGKLVRPWQLPRIHHLSPTQSTYDLDRQRFTHPYQPTASNAAIELTAESTNVGKLAALQSEVARAEERLRVLQRELRDMELRQQEK